MRGAALTALVKREAGEKGSRAAASPAEATRGRVLLLLALLEAVGGFIVVRREA